MMQSEKRITRDNALMILKQFAKEYRKELGKVPGEILIVGGGSIMLNYNFRDTTQDFDVILKTVSGVYLIAMKIRAHREFRNDISDVIGILSEERSNGHNISYDDVLKAYSNLYNETVPDELSDKLQMLFKLNSDELKAYYAQQNTEEQEIGDTLITYIKDGLNVNTRNVDEVISQMKNKLNKT